MDPSTAASGSLDVFQQALNAGVQPQQLLQILSQHNPNLLLAIQQQQQQAQLAAVQQQQAQQQQQQQAQVQAQQQAQAQQQQAQQQAQAQQHAQQQAQQQQQQQQQQQLASSAPNLLLAAGLPANLQSVLSMHQAHQQQLHQQQAAAAAAQNPQAALLLQQQALAIAKQRQEQAAAAQQQVQQQQAAAQQQQQQQQLPQTPMQTCLPWPETTPLVQIPHFDSETYKRVNIDIPYSSVPSGMDLPINNVDTLRFFFNFGICQARLILEKQLRSIGLQPQPNQQLSILLKSLAMAQSHNSANERINLSNLHAQQQALLDRQQQQQSLTSPAASIHQIQSLQSQLAQHMAARSGVSGGLKVNDMTEAMMLQSALITPGLAQLRSQSTGGHAFIPPSAMGVQQPNVSQHQHPFEQELIRPTPVNHLLAAATANVASVAAANSLSNSVAQAQQAALNALQQRSSNTSTPNLQTSTSTGSTVGGLSASATPNGHHNIPSASPKVSIPVDPAPRKSSSAVAGHQEINDLQHRGLMALRSPSLMNDNLQRSIAAADAAFNGGTPTSDSLPTTSGTQHTDSSNYSIQQQHSHGENNKPVALGAQLSVALCQHYASQPASVHASDASISSTANNNSTSTSVTSSTLGGIGIASGLNPGAKSITTGSAGIEKPFALGYPSVMEVDGGPTILQASEMHYTETLKKNSNFLPANNDSRSSPMSGETRRKSGLYALPNNGEAKEEKKEKNEKPLIPMINYVNNCLSQAKTQLHNQGVGVGIEMLSKPVNYASRPIDPIFREANISLDRMNPYNVTNKSAVGSMFLRNNNQAAAAADGGGSGSNGTHNNCIIGIAGTSSTNSDGSNPDLHGHNATSTTTASSSTTTINASISNNNNNNNNNNGVLSPPEEGEIRRNNNDNERRRKDYHGSSTSSEEIDVVDITSTNPTTNTSTNQSSTTTSGPSAGKKHNRDDDLSSPDEKRLRIASSDDE